MKFSYKNIFYFFYILIIFFFLDFFYSKYQNNLDKKFTELNNHIYIKHNYYHHDFKKNETAKERWGKLQNTLKTNSLGFKDEDNFYINKSLTSRRVLFIGDSFTEGVGLDYSDTFVGIINKNLKKQKIETLNAARSSYSPIIYWRKTKYLLENEKLQFTDLVVFIDISDAEDEAKYYFLNEKDQVIDKKIDSKNYKKESFNLGKFIFINFKMTHNFKNIIFNISQNPWSKILSDSYERDKWTIKKSAYENYGRDGNKLMKKYMDKLYNLTKKHNITLTIAVYPWPTQIWNNDLESIHVKIWKKWAEEKRITFFNFFPDFINTNSDNKTEVLKKYFIPGDIHFNKKGNELIADSFLKKFK